MERSVREILKRCYLRGEINVGEGDLTHYLGNDDYFERGKERSKLVKNPKLDGFEATGNEDDVFLWVECYEIDQ